MVSIPVGSDINEIIAANPPGTTFQLAAGIHRITQGIVPKQDTIIEGVYKGGHRASVLSGSKVLKNWRFDKRYWWIGNQNQQGQDPSVDVCQPNSPACHFPEDLFMNGMIIKRVLSVDEVRPGAWFFDYSTNRIYLGDNPHGNLVETSVTPFVFVSPGVAVNNVVLQDITIDGFATPTAQGAVNFDVSRHGVSNWGVQRCEIRNCHGGAVWNDTETFTKECYIHHNGGFGLLGAGGNIVVEGNEICCNNTCGYNAYWGAGGSKWVWTSGLIVRGNWSHHNGGPGLWTDINNIHTLYENNIVEDNELDGIFHEISYDAIIRNNTCKRNGTIKPYPWWTVGAGIEVNGSRNVEVYGNLLEDNWQGITGLDTNRGNGNDGPWALLNFRVHDNHVITTVQNGGGRTGVIGAPSALFERNHYVFRGSAEPFFWGDVSMNEDQWRAIPQDVHGTFTRE